MGHVEGSSRYQRSLVSASLDERLSADHPVRVIDAFVDGLDLRGLGFKRVATAATGRPPYAPGDLLKLYLYGYLNQVRSSRRLEKESLRNLEVHWLLNEVSPSFKTIADFRRDHPEALVSVCRTFVQFCRSWSLLGGEVVAVDGSKFEAVASRKKVITPKSLAKQTERLDRRIAEYLAAMDEADAQEASEDQPVDVAAALAALRERREAVQAQAKALLDEGLTQRVIGEEDAALMKTARHGYQAAYNAQTAVDAQHGLIAAFDLTSEANDQRQLLPMAQAAKAALDAESLTIVADTGYSNGEQGRQCEAAGMTPVVPRAQVVNTAGAQFFSREAFTYDPTADTFTCPAGQVLAHKETSHSEHRNAYWTDACKACALKSACTKAARRKIYRDFYEDDRQAMHLRAVAEPGWMKLRRELAEHPFGVIKAMMGYPRFLVRGRKKAKGELAIAVLAFNLKRVIAILGAATLIEKLQAIPA